MMSGNESIGVSYYTILSRRRKYCNAINRCLQEIVVSDSPSITDRCTYLIQSIPKTGSIGRFALYFSGLTLVDGKKFCHTYHQSPFLTVLSLSNESPSRLNSHCFVDGGPSRSRRYVPT